MHDVNAVQEASGRIRDLLRYECGITLDHSLAERLAGLLFDLIDLYTAELKNNAAEEENDG